jgi:hypothetical protein
MFVDLCIHTEKSNKMQQCIKIYYYNYNYNPAWWLLLPQRYGQ